MALNSNHYLALWEAAEITAEIEKLYLKALQLHPERVEVLHDWNALGITNNDDEFTAYRARGAYLAWFMRLYLSARRTPDGTLCVEGAVKTFFSLFTVAALERALVVRV